MRTALILLAVALIAIDAAAATPFIDSVSPPSANPGTGPLVLTIHGASFATGATVQAGAQTLAANVLSSSRLIVTLPASALAVPHTATLTVTNSATPRGSVSNTILFPIAEPSADIVTTQTLLPFFQPRALTTADFDLDGNEDLAVSNWCGVRDPLCSSGRITILPGSGNGSFGASITVDVCPTITVLRAADINNDGKPDLASICEDQGVQILIGDGTGHFQSPRTFGVPQRPNDPRLRGIAAVDVNGDGNLDIAVGGLIGVAVMLGDGTGALGQVSSICSACEYAFELAPGDFNNDGRPDFATVNYYDHNVTLLIGDGRGQFTTHKVPIDFDSYSLVAADLNGDGNTDLVVGTGSDPAARSAILFGDGTGAFTAGPRFSASVVRKIVAGDLNGDGRTDLALETDSNGLVYALADGPGSLALTFTNFFRSGTVSLADFNNDGKLDFAVLGSSDSRVTVLQQTPSAVGRHEYGVTDICQPQSCYAWLLSDNGVAAGHNFAVYPTTGILDFVQRTGQTFEPFSINGAGVIAGSAGFIEGQSPETGYAALWLPDRAQLLNLNPVFGWTHGIASSINNAGRVVGYSRDGPPVRELLPGYSLKSVSLITDDLSILATDSTGPLYAVQYSSSPVFAVIRLPIPALALFNSTGQVLLSAPQIGSLFTFGSGTVSQPPAPGFNVVAFNSFGQFIGRTLPGNVPGIYTAPGGVVPLNSLLPPGSPWTITNVNAINNNGQILANATNGPRSTTVLLTPATGPSSPRATALLQRSIKQPRSVLSTRDCQAFTFNAQDVCGASAVDGARQRDAVQPPLLR